MTGLGSRCLALLRRQHRARPKRFSRELKEMINQILFDAVRQRVVYGATAAAVAWRIAFADAVFHALKVALNIDARIIDGWSCKTPGWPSRTRRCRPPSFRLARGTSQHARAIRLTAGLSGRHRDYRRGERHHDSGHG
jgi:hypothetical protein